MNNLKILHCFSIYSKSDCNWLINILRHLESIHYIASTNFLIKYPLLPNIKCLIFPLPLINANINNKILKIINLPTKIIIKIFYYFYLSMIIKNKQIDIIHAHYGPIGWHYRKIAEKLNKPFIISFYGYDYEYLPYTQPIWKKRYQELFKQANLILCEGSNGGSILKKMGCPKEKIIISKLGVNVSNIPYFKREKKEHNLKLIQIATFTEKKGHIYTVKAFIKALKECPNMSLTLVGSNFQKGIKENIIKEIAQNNIKDKITCIDHIDYDELYSFLKEFQVFIHPSCYSNTMDCEGGAPVVLLDAQATGMPIISTTHCDIPEEVINGKTGILVPEKNIDKLAEEIKAFYEMDQKIYDEFSINARNHIETNYNAQTNALNLYKIYSKIID